MNTIKTLALGAVIAFSAAAANAAPWDFFKRPDPPKHDHRDDHRNDHRDDRRGDRRGDGRGDRFDDRRDHRQYRSTEARAQARLRELGYYRGPVDGDFGRGSRAALVRFQRDNRIPPNARLDVRTLRALRIG